MADNVNDLNARLVAAAAGKVDSSALRSRYGIDCFALVDALLRSVRANSAHDYNDEVRVTATADYKWGDGILLDSIRPGDIVQFRKHLVQVWIYEQQADGSWFMTEEKSFTRPHHTGIVMSLLKGGGVEVVEQNVKPSPRKVTRNSILRLAPGEDTRYETKGKKEVKIKIKVTGGASAYRPVAKPKKGASLLRPTDLSSAGQGSLLARASYLPAQGGVKRRQGPVGIG
jgi:hypothetical protein